MLDLSNDINGYKWYNVAFWKKMFIQNTSWENYDYNKMHYSWNFKTRLVFWNTIWASEQISSNLITDILLKTIFAQSYL